MPSLPDDLVKPPAPDVPAYSNKPYSKDIARLRLALPSAPEQQKIADCLTSLDELIVAESQKLKVLKAHKQGLMQQLFPREGETRPRLRFPEFQNAGEWEETRLGRLGELFSFSNLTDTRSKSREISVLRLIRSTEANC